MHRKFLLLTLPAVLLSLSSCDSPSTESSQEPIALSEEPASESAAAIVGATIGGEHPADCSHCSHQALGVEMVELFNGKNLDGWSHHLVDTSLNKEDVWSVQDGVLICKGEPLGYLYTDAKYKDFVLNLEWRWPAGSEPGNSGVLMRIAGKPESFLPQCVEAQLKHQNAGDVYGFYGAKLSGDPSRFKVIQSGKIGDFNAVSKIIGAELPPGEWNHYRIKVLSDTIKVHINGELVNEAHGMDILAGPIGLQSEGGEIHFRNIRLEPLTAE